MPVSQLAGQLSDAGATTTYHEQYLLDTVDGKWQQDACQAQ